MNPNYIFRYKLSGAWGKLISKFEILDSDSNNLILTYEENQTRETISQEDILKIKDIILNNPYLKKIEDFEFPSILDGTTNIFEFKVDNIKHEISGNNLWYFTDEDNIEEYTKFFNESPENALKLIEIFKQIKEVLIKYGIDEKYFTL